MACNRCGQSRGSEHAINCRYSGKVGHSSDRSARVALQFHLDREQLEIVLRALEGAVGFTTDPRKQAEALEEICRAYVKSNG